MSKRVRGKLNVFSNYLPVEPYAKTVAFRP